MKKIFLLILLITIPSFVYGEGKTIMMQYGGPDLSGTTFTFTTEGDLPDPLASTLILLAGDNDTDNDAIDLQNGTKTGQRLYLIAVSGIDANDTCTINYGDTTCTNCPATIFDKVGESAHLIWTGSTWVVVSLMDAL